MLEYFCLGGLLGEDLVVLEFLGLLVNGIISHGDPIWMTHLDSILLRLIIILAFHFMLEGRPDSDKDLHIFSFDRGYISAL